MITFGPPGRQKGGEALKKDVSGDAFRANVTDIVFELMRDSIPGSQGGKRKEVRGQGEDAAVCYPLQIRLFRNDTEAAKKTRRFLVIEFSLRQFPVEQETGMDLLLFTSPELFGISDPARANFFIDPFFFVKM